MNTIKVFLCDADYIFLNYFVANIPCWHIRKIFYLLHGMKIGKKTRINMKTIVYAPWKIRIGNNSIVNEHALLDGRGHLIIGDNVSVSMYSILYTASHYSWSLEFEYYTKKTTLHDGVWIGARAVVMPGSEIMDHSIIAANSVYSGGVSEARKVYRGNPAEVCSDRRISEREVHLKTIMFFK